MSVVIYNTLIHALCKRGSLSVCKKVMGDMVENDCEPNEATFHTLTTTCCRLCEITEEIMFLEKGLTKGYIHDAITLTKLIDVLSQEGRLHEAIELM